MSKLPEITDPVARRSALSKMVWMLNGGGQNDLALKYARQIKSSFPSDKGQCEGDLSIGQTLLQAKKLDSSSPEIREAIDACLKAGQVVSANAMRIELAERLTEEGRPKESIALLKRIAPSIEQAGYQFHVGSLHLGLASAYAKLGDDDNARAYALKALDDNGPGKVNFVTQGANQILYEVAKRAGHADEALSYYEKYVALKQSSMDDAKARALAYQMVKQDVLAKKLNCRHLARRTRFCSCGRPWPRRIVKPVGCISRCCWS